MIESIDAEKAAKARNALRTISKVQRSQINYIADDAIPVDRQGTLVLPMVPMRPMVGEFYKTKNLTDEVIASYLQGLMGKFFRAIENKDEQTVRDLTEPTFG